MAGFQGTQTLRDPEALQRCLAAIGLPGATPAVVDLARFQGREAAILVVPSSPGTSYEVWAVSRNCGVLGDDDGSMLFRRIAR
jgi:hypothetical protein